MNRARDFLVIGLILFVATGLTVAETHWQVQAVGETGHATYYKVGATPTEANEIVLEGIVLNNPEDILDMTPDYNENPWDMGAQWQIFVQGLGDDHAGTACWMGQNYGNFPFGTGRYTNDEWTDEMNRLNYDGGHHLRMGDLVRITGYSCEYNGKSNINERHDTTSYMDFAVDWLDQTPGLPGPEMITLSDVKDDANSDIFDQTRRTGGEYYQVRLVRINNVKFTDPENWGRGERLTLTDGTGRTLPCRLGIGDEFNGSSNLDEWFDVIGIFNQEKGYTEGYEIWVTQYNGSTNLLGIPEPTSLILMLIAVTGLIRRGKGIQSII